MSCLWKISLPQVIHGIYFFLLGRVSPYLTQYVWLLFMDFGISTPFYTLMLLFITSCISKLPYEIVFLLSIKKHCDFPGRPVVKTLPSNAGGAGSIPGWGVKIPHASWPKTQSIKQKQYCNKFNKDFIKWTTSKKNLFKKKHPLEFPLVLVHWWQILSIFLYENTIVSS